MGGKRKNLAQLNAEGEYSLVEPLDYLILAELQEEGTLMGGYYPLATHVKALHKHFKKELPITMLSARLRVLHQQKLAVPVGASSQRISGWQRTAKGKELVEAWQQETK